jgi:hypothetical protein
VARARGLEVNPDVVQYLPDQFDLSDKRDQSHLATAHRVQQRKNLVDAGDQHCPQVVRRWALGRHGLGLSLDDFAHWRQPRRSLALARVS